MNPTMTKTEHLQRIRARCLELLALAEKRTPGKWERANATTVRQAEHRRIVLADCGGGCCTSVAPQSNAAFISSCAGSAEAGWKAAIAAIDAWERLGDLAVERGDMASGLHIGHLLGSIIAAWPEEIL